ncbi:hypothetical protein MMC26_005590 [Xylographa opegraphella]|nr:hypothetical protein [Xylographa opegraphella]
MQRPLYTIAAMALASATSVLGQDTTGNPLNVFISLAGGAVTAVETAVATQSTPSASSTSPASAPASTTSAGPAATSTTTAAAAAASPGGLSHQTLLDIVIPVAVIGAVLLALLALCIYCCLRRRRRSHRATTPVPDEEVTTWRRPSNPGRAYAPPSTHPIPMSQSPTVPLMAAGPSRPYPSDHPAFRNHHNPNAANPFVPSPPSPRRTAPNARAGLTDGMVAGAPAFMEAAPGPRVRKSRSMSRSTSGAGLYDSYGGPHSPYGNTTTVSAAPHPTSSSGGGLTDPYDRFGGPQAPYYDPYGELAVPALEHALPGTQAQKRDRPPTPFGFGGPPAPAPPSPGPHSPYARIGSPYTEQHVQQLQTDRPSIDLLRADPSTTMPPRLPSRSPNRRSAFHDSTYDSFGSGAGERAPASVDSGSGSGDTSVESWQTSRAHVAQPQPWEDRERRYSAGSGARRYSASSSRVSVGGGRRLRFSDVEGEGGEWGVGGRRVSQGVGEAL